PPSPSSTLFPYTTLFRSLQLANLELHEQMHLPDLSYVYALIYYHHQAVAAACFQILPLQEKYFALHKLPTLQRWGIKMLLTISRSEEHTSELQSRENLVC